MESNDHPILTPTITGVVTTTRGRDIVLTTETAVPLDSVHLISNRATQPLSSRRAPTAKCSQCHLLRLTHANTSSPTRTELFGVRCSKEVIYFFRSVSNVTCTFLIDCNITYLMDRYALLSGGPKHLQKNCQHTGGESKPEFF